jgi:phage terminase large subunit
MPFTATTATKRVLATNKRIRLLSGGTSASKTISILLYLIDAAQSDTKPTLTSVVSESFPHLKRGAMRDFLNIMQEHRYFKDGLWNKSDFTYTFETGSRIEFFSADMPSKVRGPRRDRLFVNEANNVAKESWDQLLLRTREMAFADWNPTADFYMYQDYGLEDEGVPRSTDPNVDFMILTYKDNEGLEPSIVQEIEKRQINKGWWRVYGEGKRGEVEGKIYKGWLQVPEVPHEARLERYGLDFGYSVDPASCVAIYYYNGGYIIDELFHRTEMKNRQIADVLLNQPDPNVLVCADSAEPKSIAELQEYGVNTIGVAKGRGSVNHGIQWVQSQKISYTKRSLNVRKAYNNYMWMTDKDGNILDKPDHFLSDAMDAVRYGFEGLRPQPTEDDEPATSLTSTLVY